MLKLSLETGSVSIKDMIVIFIVAFIVQQCFFPKFNIPGIVLGNEIGRIQ